MVKNFPTVREIWVRYLISPWDIREIPWRREWLPTLVFLPREFYGQRNLADYSPWITKSWTQLSN